jgi:hypothetical protein
MWKVISLINLVCIIAVVVYSDYISTTLDGYKTHLLSLDTPTDSQVVMKVVMERWQGISLAFNLMFIFFLRKLFGVFKGALNKVTT